MKLGDVKVRDYKNMNSVKDGFGWIGMESYGFLWISMDF